MMDIPAVLLVGGMGTRLRSILPSTPKPLALLGTTPFLELLIEQLHSQGIHRLVMCTGYLADQIERAFGDGAGRGVAIQYSREQHPLGTAGAIRLARDYLRETPQFLVMNGDSFLEVDLEQLIRFHAARQALATLAVVRVPEASRYGTVRTAADGRVVGFSEKAESKEGGLINGGVYVFDRAILDHIPPGAASLEKDILPRILSRKVYAQEQCGMFIDIGIPDDYARAQVLCQQLHETASRR